MRRGRYLTIGKYRHKEHELYATCIAQISLRLTRHAEAFFALEETIFDNTESAVFIIVVVHFAPQYLSICDHNM